MDESLKSYARAYVLRARPDIDHRCVDGYVMSKEFGRLVGKFESGLLDVLDQYLDKIAVAAAAARGVPDATRAAGPRPLAQAAATPEARRRMAFPELAKTPAAAQVPAASVPVPAPTPAQSELAGAVDVPAGVSDAAPETASEGCADPVPPRPEATAPAPATPVELDAPAAPAASAAPAVLRAVPAPRPGSSYSRPPVQEALPPQDLPDIGFRLPNGRAGSAYAHRLEAIDGAEPVVFDEVAIPPALALAADLETGAVSGTPPVAGDYTITVIYHYARQSSSRRRRAHVPVAVAPDPRTMWQNLPSDRNDPYWKEDEQHSSVRGPQLSIVAASKRGRSHAHVGSFRDDDYRIEHLADAGWYVAVVADGAGSARYSRRGAAIICEQAKKHIIESLTDSTVAQIDALAQAYAQARSGGLPQVQVDVLHGELQTNLSRIVGNAAYWAVKAIHDETQARRDLGGVLKDYSSTALISVCKRYDFGTLCAAYWIGDGAIGIYSKRDGVTLLGEVDSGEFSGQTRFLDNAAVSQEVLLKRTRFALVDDMTALVLMTDGVSDAKFETEARLARAADWHAFWDELEQAVGFAKPAPEQAQDQARRLLDWLDFWSQGNHDDRTIAVIY